VSGYIKDIVKEPRAEARSRYGKTGKGKPPSPPTPSTTAAAAATATRPVPAPGASAAPPAFGGTRAKPTKGGINPIRIVDTGTLPWERKTGFAGEHVEVTPRIPELVDLVRAIESDTEAKKALSKFLQALEAADVL
jgi:hypothetical protein